MMRIFYYYVWWCPSQASSYGSRTLWQPTFE